MKVSIVNLPLRVDVRIDCLSLCGRLPRPIVDLAGSVRPYQCSNAGKHARRVLEWNDTNSIFIEALVVTMLLI